MTIWRMRIAYWIPKATNTHSEYVTLIVFPPQEWIRERATISRYTYTVSLPTIITVTKLSYFSWAEHVTRIESHNKCNKRIS